MERVVGLRETVGETAARCCVEGGGWTLSERLMRPLRVVFADKAIESILLLKERRCCGSRGFRLQRSMHTLVPAVLLGVSRLGAFVPDAQPKP